MKNFTKGILVGIGVGLLVAPLSGRETRRLLAERAREWRNSLPEDSPINQYITLLSERVTSAKENWRTYAQQAVSKAKDTGSAAIQSGQEMASKARQTGQEMASKARQTGMDMASRAKQSGQEIASKAKEVSQGMTSRTKQGVGISGSSTNGTSTRVFPETDE